MKLDTVTRDPTRYYSVLGYKGPTDLDLIVVPLQVLHNTNQSLCHNPTHDLIKCIKPFLPPESISSKLPPCHDRVLSPIIQQEHYHRPHRHHARTNHHAARCTVPGKHGRADPPHHPHWKKKKLKNHVRDDRGVQKKVMEDRNGRKREVMGSMCRALFGQRFSWVRIVGDCRSLLRPA